MVAECIPLAFQDLTKAFNYTAPFDLCEEIQRAPPSKLMEPILMNNLLINEFNSSLIDFLFSMESFAILYVFFPFPMCSSCDHDISKDARDHE